MNPLKAEAALYVDHAWIMGVTTALFLACFIGWTWWAYSRRNREHMDRAALMPLED